jgi:hypothetical protein
MADIKLETIDDVLVALGKLAKDAKALAAAMHKAADASTAIDAPTFAFCHRLKAVLVDMGHQLETLEMPDRLREAR